MFLCVCCDGISLELKPTLEPKLGMHGAGDKANAEAGNYIPIDNCEAEQITENTLSRTNTGLAPTF